MSSERKVEITKENIDTYLKAVAKEYRKLVGKTMPAELILIGGASILINYGFRGATTDVDALIQANSSMKDAINRVGDQYNLPNGWLNADFMKTSSYTPKLVRFSTYYRTFSNVLTVRTIAAEYLIAMKLRSGRVYKKDLSDVLGILAEHEAKGTPISMEQIQKAVTDLYGDWSQLSESARNFIERAMENGSFAKQYEAIAEGEQQAQEALIAFQEEYPGVMTTDNVETIVHTLAARESVLAQLRKPKTKESEQTEKKEKRLRKSDLER